MKTLLKLGPADRDRPLTLEEFLEADYQTGFKYELIDGRLYVAPEANLPEAVNEWWLFRALFLYTVAHPEVINFVWPKTRVFVANHTEPTAPEPDLAAYHDFPLHQPRNTLRWQDHEPILVVEVVSEGDPNKDLVRNVDLYLEVSSIREYWILDGRADADRPTLLVYRRRGQRWQNVIQVPTGGTYMTKLLPDFTLVVDPHS
jgi:Uma2 family endonuclease